MNRRGFLGAILAAGSAPAIIKIENAMRLWVPRAPTWMAGFEDVPITYMTVAASAATRDKTAVCLYSGKGLVGMHTVQAGQTFKNVAAATLLDRLDNFARANALGAALGRQIEHEIATRPARRIVLSG
jgi:hypothetical protein